VLTTAFTHEDPLMENADDIALEITHNVDPVLGFTRVITQVNTNANVFRGWGPKVLT
jgi:hypothetical protein